MTQCQTGAVRRHRRTLTRLASLGPRLYYSEPSFMPVSVSKPPWPAKSRAGVLQQAGSQRVAAREQEGFFERPLDLAVEPLQWPRSEQADSTFDPSAYAPPATREASGIPPGQKQDITMYAPRRVIAPAAAALKPGSRALKELQPSLLDRLARHDYLFPPLHILAEPKNSAANKVSEELARPERQIA